MRIVNREAFIDLPPGTVYSLYESCFFSGLFIKSDTLAACDFVCLNLIGNVKSRDSGEYVDNVEGAVITGDEIELDFEQWGRDGLFDDDQLFAIYSDSDVADLVSTISHSRIQDRSEAE